jgi:hypothetical protein
MINGKRYSALKTSNMLDANFETVKLSS